jgi:hypothetical protein
MSSQPQYSHVWTPGPTESHFRIRSTVDVLSLALAWTELPQFGLLIAVLDVDDRVVAMVTDPSPDLIRAPAQCTGPGLTRPVHGIALLTMTRATSDRFDPPSLFPGLQRHYRASGIRLVDWVLIDFEPDGFRSMQLETRGRRRQTARHLRAGVCV